MNFEWIKNCVNKNDYYFSKHSDQERMNDNLTISDIEQAILSGKIIEDYIDDVRGESCLIAGFSDSGIPVHIVCGKRNNKPVIITVYIPKPPKFKNPFERS